MLVPRKINLADVNYRVPDDDPDLISAFIQVNGSIPSVFKMDGPYLYYEIEDVIKKHFKDAIREWEFEEDFRFKIAAYRATHNNKHIIIRLRRSIQWQEGTYLLPSISKVKKYVDDKYGLLLGHGIEILYDIQAGKPETFISAMRKIELPLDVDHNKIGLVCQDPHEGGFYVREFPMDKREFYEFDLDLHYGDGYSKFHEITIKRMEDNEKGIVLFFGAPGSGKTYAIRRLVCDLMKKNKRILYLPSNMADVLGTPIFNDFLIQMMDSDFDDGPSKTGILLIIEDAERVLMKRETNSSADLVSNILNSTDGILNDFLKIQVLASFNTGIGNIDSAILRKKRVIAVREFKKLSIEQAQRLVNHLNLNQSVSEEMSLADVYSLKQEEEDKILLEGLKPKKGTIGFNK